MNYVRANIYNLYLLIWLDLRYAWSGLAGRRDDCLVEETCPDLLDQLGQRYEEVRRALQAEQDYETFLKGSHWRRLLLGLMITCFADGGA